MLIKLDEAERVIHATIINLCLKDKNTCAGDYSAYALQALRALPVSDGVTDEMVEVAARALCEKLDAIENDWHGFTGLARAALEAALGATVSDGWEDIATLPSFTDALVCVTYNVPAEENDQRPPTDVEGYVWETVQWVDCRNGDKGWFAFPHLIHVPFPPTKWRPLPAPPSE